MPHIQINILVEKMLEFSDFGNSALDSIPFRVIFLYLIKARLGQNQISLCVDQVLARVQIVASFVMLIFQQILWGRNSVDSSIVFGWMRQLKGERLIDVVYEEEDVLSCVCSPDFVIYLLKFASDDVGR